MKNFSYPRKLHIRTYGCQMNIYDTSRMKNMLRSKGFIYTEEIKEADLIILNTCHIREKASEKIYSELGKIKVLKDERKKSNLDLIIVVAGCVAQAEGEEIFKRARYVDIIVGPQSYQTLPEMVENIINDEKAKKQINLEFETDKKFDFLEEEEYPQGISAFLTIQEGCDKFCKFCCVPYTRGAEYSRPAHEIFRDAMNIAGNGAKEITLLGQNVSSYMSVGPENKNIFLGQLINLIGSIPSIERIRYTTSHPNDMQDDLIKAHKDEPKLMPFLHLPVQSGSDKILKNMNRRHNVQTYLELIDRFRASRPDIAFSSDFIVGYPGETDKDFQDTIKLVKEVGYAQCYSFKYSIRPGTPAAEAKNQIEENIKSERILELQSVINDEQKKFNDRFIGRSLKILLDRPGKREGQAIGKSEYMQSVHVDNASDLLGQIIEVTITNSLQNSLAGSLINKNVKAA